MTISINTGRDVMNAKLAAAEGRVARFMWAGALANGAALVALVGLVGNVTVPDAALTALSIPLLIFATGVFAGGQAGGHLAVIAELEVLVATDAALYEIALPAAVSDSLRDLQLTLAILEGRFYGEAKPTPRRMGEAKARFEEVAQFVSKRSAEYATLKQKRSGRLGRWAMASFGCLLGGMVLIVAGHSLGVRLQPPAPASATAQAAPSVTHPQLTSKAPLVPASVGPGKPAVPTAPSDRKAPADGARAVGVGLKGS